MTNSQYVVKCMWCKAPFEPIDNKAVLGKFFCCMRCIEEALRHLIEEAFKDDD